jgi:hypothetical protein
MKKIVFVGVINLLTGQLLLAQDLDAIESKVRAFSFKKGITMNGSLNVNTVNYFASGIEGRRDPFNWYSSANINLNVFGLDVPFSFSYTNARLNYTQPFNRIRFAPKYKWVKTYTGTTNMTFSNYTLAGHQFKGFGFELTPGKWRVMGMYGKLKEAIPYSDQRNGNYGTNVSFKRMGHGLKIGYENDGEMIEAIYFKAKDDINSIPVIPSGGLARPQENIVIGLTGKKKIGKRLFIDAEYAVSGLTADLRSDTSIRESKNYSLVSKFIKSRNTTRFYDAVNAGIGYTGDNYAIQVKYERISPEYQTLGAYYFNSDMENYTIMPTLRLLKGKINFTGNVGVQLNNLDKLKSSTTKRFVGNMNVNLILSEKWNLAGTYSNFSTVTNVRPQIDPFFQNSFDTLDFYQVNQTFNAVAGYNFGNRSYRHGIMLNASYQKANDESIQTTQKNFSNFYSGNLSYSLSIAEKNINLAGGFNYNRNIAIASENVFMGPSVNWSQGFFNKAVRSSASISYNKSKVNHISSSDILNLRWNMSYAPPRKKQEKKRDAQPVQAETSALPSAAKKQRKKYSGTPGVSLSIGYVQRFKNAVYKNQTNETTINVSYMYSFR